MDGLPPAIQSANCTADDVVTLTKNVWKCLCVEGVHVRVRPSDTSVPVIPEGDIQYIATVEVLQEKDDKCGDAGDECEAIVRRLFPGIA